MAVPAQARTYRHHYSHHISYEKSNPVLIRIFKQEHEIELWQMNSQGKFELSLIFPICKFSGHLGPKLRHGDRQAPEGFYSITRSQLRHEHRLDIGYPNEFDRQHHRTGDSIQIHGHCSSVGCFAITDDPIRQVYSRVRNALYSGQKIVQVQIYPFRMTDQTMLDNINNENIDFWLELKKGYDKFNAIHQELVVTAVDGKYIIN